MKIYMDDVRLGPFYNTEDPESDNDWVIVRSIENVKRLLRSVPIEEMSLDHDMGTKETGYDLVKWMVEHGFWSKKKPVVHSWNIVGAKDMRFIIDRHFPEKING